MLNKLCAFVRQEQMIQPGDTVICAVSGGADSVALLFAMYLLKEKLGISLAAAHFNHNLRGAESDGDEAFVRQLCRHYEIPLFVGAEMVTAGEKGLEAAAREARYGFFRSLSGKIATAHTADDNAETVLMNMLRGTGLKGLGGIAPIRGNVIRPMLSVTRQDVLAFLEEYHLAHREDSSNHADQFLRNRLRHHVMPLLEKENPCIATNLSAMALRLRQDEQTLQSLAAFSEPLDVVWLRELDPAIRCRVLETFLKKHGVKEPEASHLKMAQALVFSDNPSANARFPGGVTIRRKYDVLTAEAAETAIEATRLSCPGVTALADYRIECAEAESIVNTIDTFTVFSDGPIWVRCRENGDSLRLSGGTKSLKKLFIDRKIPAAERASVPVLSDEKGVLGAYGIGVNLDRAASGLPAWQIKIVKTGENC